MTGGKKNYPYSIHPFVSVFSVFFPFSQTQQQNQFGSLPCVSLVTQVSTTQLTILILFWKTTENYDMK